MSFSKVLDRSRSRVLETQLSKSRVVVVLVISSAFIIVLLEESVSREVCPTKVAASKVVEAAVEAVLKLGDRGRRVAVLEFSVVRSVMGDNAGL